nr:MAG TPA: hypothetical protein [Caudoviricetes sp.]
MNKVSFSSAHLPSFLGCGDSSYYKYSRCAGENQEKG